MKMKVFVLLLSSFFIFTGCTGKNPDIRKQITLSNGKTVEVILEKQTDPEPILSVDIKADEIVFREDQVEKEVLEIWSQLESEAEKKELDEALIKYRFKTDHISDKGKPIYGGLIFEATKIRAGKWRIKSVSSKR